MANLLRVFLIVASLAAPAAAQQSEVRFGGLTQDTSLPVEVTSDTLSVDQADGSALFTGNVLVIQGELRMTAERVRVENSGEGNEIERMHATGGVTLVSPTDAAEAAEAVYTIADGIVVMTGDVLLTQGTAAIAGEKLTVNLTDGTGIMTGRVKTIFTPGQKP